MKKLRLILISTICYFFLAPLFSVLGADSQHKVSTAKIIGGEITSIGDYPWMTALVHSGESAYLGQFCGASMIAPSWLVTAAHCTEESTINDIEAIIGGHNLKNDSEGERLSVVQIIQHPDYDSFTLDSDIALLQLERPSTKEYLGVISDGDPDNLAQIGTVATILGWGDTNPGPGAQYSAVLIEVNIKVLSFIIGNHLFGDDFTINMMVAGLRVGGKDTCQGDSGGPLIVPTPNNTDWILAGITSWGDGCGQAGSPGVYTKVARFSNWIKSVIDSQDISLVVAPTLQTSINGSTASAYWDAVPNADNYTFYYAPYPYLGDHTIVNMEMNSERSVSAELPSGVGYYVAVTSWMDGMETEYSNIELIVMP